MKTRAQVVDEYNNRQNVPIYSQITVRDFDGSIHNYFNVSNLVETVVETHNHNYIKWIAFDSIKRPIKQNMVRHIRIYNGTITKYIEPLSDETQNETNITPLHGFKVGDKVKYSPLGVEIFHIELSGEVIAIDNGFVTFEIEPKGSYNIRKADELLLMPND